MQDDPLKKVMSSWSNEAPPDGMLDRVVRQAMAHPQKQGVHDYAAWIGGQIFRPQQRYALGIRCATLAVCVVAGFMTGANRTPHHHEQPDIFNMQKIAMADDIIGIDKSGDDQ